MRNDCDAGSNLIKKRTILWSFLALVVWITYRPYLGLIWDANFYLAQALNVLGFDLSSDLFFQGGSQAEFTLFPLLYAWLVGWLGVELGQGFLYLFSSLMWLAGLWNLSARMNMVPWVRVVAVLGVSLTGVSYSVIGAAEQFVTARLPAEALSLYALSLLINHQLVKGLCLGLGAVLLHPLQGGWGLCVGICYLLGMKRSIPFVVLGILLCTIGVEFLVESGWFSHRLLTKVSEAEVSFHAWRSPWLIAGQWEWKDSFRLAMLLLMVMLGINSGNRTYRKLATVTTIITFSALSVFWLTFFYEEPVRLILAMQLWRVQWLFQAIAILGFAHYLSSLKDRLIGLALFISCILSSWISYISGLLFTTLLLVLMYQGGRWVNKGLLKFLWSALLLLEIFALFMYSHFTPFSYESESMGFEWGNVWRFWGMIFFLLFIFVAEFGSNKNNIQNPFNVGLLIFIFLGSVFMWDERRDSVKELEKNINLNESSDVSALIGKKESLLWLDIPFRGTEMVRASWFLAKRPNFISDPQLAGVIFNEHTYWVASERMEKLADEGLLELNSDRDYSVKWVEYSRMTSFEQVSLVERLCRVGVDVLLSKDALYDVHGKLEVNDNVYFYYKCMKEGGGANS